MIFDAVLIINQSFNIYYFKTKHGKQKRECKLFKHKRLQYLNKNSTKNVYKNEIEEQCKHHQGIHKVLPYI